MCTSDCLRRFGSFMQKCSSNLGPATANAVQQLEVILGNAGPCANPAGGGGSGPIAPPAPPPPCDLAYINSLCSDDPLMSDTNPDVMCGSPCARETVRQHEDCKVLQPEYAAASSELVGLCTGSMQLRRCASQLTDFEGTLRLACSCGDPTQVTIEWPTAACCALSQDP